MSETEGVTDSLMPETEAAKEARLRQRKTELETARRAVQKRLKELDPAFIEKKRLNLEMKEQKAAVQAGKKRDREEKREEKDRLEQQKKDEHAAEVYARGQDKRDMNRDRMRARRANEKETASNVSPTTPPPSNVPHTTPPSWRQTLNEEPTPGWRLDDLGVVPNNGQIDRLSAMADA